jgi:hypothetical protein
MLILCFFAIFGLLITASIRAYAEQKGSTTEDDREELVTVSLLIPRIRAHAEGACQPTICVPILGPTTNRDIVAHEARLETAAGGQKRCPKP